MQFKNLFAAAVVASSAVSLNASAQIVTVGFGAAPQSVPLSPWLTALMAAMLAVAVAAFLRKHIGSGAFMLMLSVMIGGMALRAEDSIALPPALLTLVTSPAVSNNLNFVCLDKPAGLNSAKLSLLPYTLDVVSNVNTVINSIAVADSPIGKTGNVAKVLTPQWSIDSTNSTCKVGKALNTSEQCTVVLTISNCFPQS